MDDVDGEEWMTLMGRRRRVDDVNGGEEWSMGRRRGVDGEERS